jgi:hypothetical protein
MPHASRANLAGNLKDSLCGNPSVHCHIQGDPMPTTFQKRQKEMKRLEKQRTKAERRAEKKLAKRAGIDTSENEASIENEFVPVQPEIHS